MRWQMALYKEMAGKAEDADAPVKVVKRVQEVSAVLYHLEVVREEIGSGRCLSTVVEKHALDVPVVEKETHSVLLVALDGASIQIKEDGVAQTAV